MGQQHHTGRRVSDEQPLGRMKPHRKISAEEEGVDVKGTSMCCRGWPASSPAQELSITPPPPSSRLSVPENQMF